MKSVLKWTVHIRFHPFSVRIIPMYSTFHLIPLLRDFQFLCFHHSFADMIETGWYHCLFSFLYSNFHFVQGRNQYPRMKHSEIYPASVWGACSFVLPLEFGTFAWTSRILNSDISTFYKSKSFSSKHWETTAAV